MTKILVSPPFGAGWSTWSGFEDWDREAYWLTYPPIVEFIEQGGVFRDQETHVKYVGTEPDLSTLHPLLRRFVQDYTAKFHPEGDDPHFYFGGATGLAVVDVQGPFLVQENDGSEWVTTVADLRTLP